MFNISKLFLLTTKARQFVWLLCLIISVFFSSLYAQDNSIKVVLDSQPNGGYIVSASFTITANTQLVWDTLSDYSAIYTYVKGMKISRIITSNPTKILEQKWQTNIMFIPVITSVNLILKEVPGEKISFRSLTSDTFEYYFGEWQIKSKGNQSEVLYNLSVRPKITAFNFLIDGVLNENIKDLMEDVKIEIERRLIKSK